VDEEDGGLFEEDELFDLQDGPDLFVDPDEPQHAELPPDAAAADPAARTEEEVTASLMEAVDALREPPTDVDRPDAPLALYRRYRPDTFAEVIGQEHVTEPLQRALANNRVNHAYLFSGPRGCGKTTSARILARCLNCAEGPTPVPCGTCQSCRDLARGGTGSIDVIEIDAASHGGVDDARDLRERAFFAPVHSRYKIYIIDEAHMVTPQGFNALLKVVEEPPPHVRFVFATTEPDKVLGTIRSRTHHYPFRLVPPKTLQAYLAELCEAEGIAVEPSVLPLVVRAGAGSVRDSLSVLDQLLGGAAEGGVSYVQAAALLGYTPDALLDEIVDAFAAGDARSVFAAIDKVIEVGQDPRRFAEDLLRRLRDLIIVAAVPEALSSGLVDVSDDQAERLNAQASAMGPGELTRAAEVIAVGLTEMRGTTAPRLHLELMCARVLLPASDFNDRGLHARVDRLERRLALGVPQADLPAAEPARAAAEPARPAPEPARPAESQRPVPQPQRSQPEATPADDGPPWDVPEPTPATRTASESAHPKSAASRPTTQPEPAVQQRTDEPPTAPTAPTAPVAPGSLGVADLRRLWPQILDNVKDRRRFTWILLSQNSQVVEVRDDVVTIGLANPGARDSFGKGGSSDVLRDAILDVLGATVRIETILDATADSPASGASAAPAGRGRASAPEPEPEPDRDDAEVSGDSVSSEELLRKHLGAELLDDEG